MGWASERKYQLTDLKLSVVQALAHKDIFVPEYPNPNLNYPGSWLVRAEANRPERLTNPKVNNFEPQFGEYGSFGVFLGSCLNSLMFVYEGVYYVFKSEELTSDWLVTPSPEWNQRFRQAAQQNDYNVNQITEGILAEQTLYRNYPVFQRGRGICTIPKSVAVSSAHLILATRQFFLNRCLGNCSEEISRKLTII